MIKTKVPGKLFIAGEYAVVHSGHLAVLAAVDQFVTVRLSESQDRGIIRSKQYMSLDIEWKRINSSIVIEKLNNPYHYILASIEVTERYIEELGYPLDYYTLTVDSELDAQSGKKYGLGSSAAVTVGTIRALLAWYGLKSSPELEYKLGAIAHLSLESNGSFGDLASCAYEGWIAYSCFDRKWVKDRLKTQKLKELVKEDWPLLTIESLPELSDLNFIAVWSQKSASTPQLVQKVSEQIDRMGEAYQDFLKQSHHCVELMIEGFKEDNASKVTETLNLNRQLLRQLADLSHVPIETEHLSQMIDAANDAGASAKTSGAGGGDCVIAFYPKQLSRTSIVKAWEGQQVDILDLKVYHGD